jgi:hypothetical protein
MAAWNLLPGSSFGSIVMFVMPVAQLHEYIATVHALAQGDTTQCKLFFL